MISRTPVHILLILAVLLCVFTGCDSPLGLDTPRKEYIDRVGSAVRHELCDPVSIDFPIDTTLPDPNYSSVLVFDGSESISAQLNAAMKAAGHAYLDSLDGERDEAAVVFFNSIVTVYQRMTTDVVNLRRAVDALPTVGATAMWDGIFTGLLELEARARHGRKALIVVTETRDNSSKTGTPTKIIEKARANSVAIYTISMAIGIDEGKLAELAMESGGQHYRLPRLNQLTDIYREIAHRLNTP
jgi:Mg-chelatase subunit ChlD